MAWNINDFWRTSDFCGAGEVAAWHNEKCKKCWLIITPPDPRNKGTGTRYRYPLRVWRNLQEHRTWKTTIVQGTSGEWGSGWLIVVVAAPNNNGKSMPPEQEWQWQPQWKRKAWGTLEQHTPSNIKEITSGHNGRAACQRNLCSGRGEAPLDISPELDGRLRMLTTVSSVHVIRYPGWAQHRIWLVGSSSHIAKKKTKQKQQEPK